MREARCQETGQYGVRAGVAGRIWSRAAFNMNEPVLTNDPSRPAPPSPWILVVDDEPSMRMLIEVVLNSQGWAVVAADGAEDALDILKARARPPAVVICDVLMPGLDGLELVRRMCARLPDLNVIFISGRLSDVSWWPTDLREHRFLAKPFEKAQLIEAVRGALSDAGAGA
jgi:CheY-like chemotaxis protein